MARREQAPETARRLDEAVRGILERAWARATELLQQHRAVMEDGARELLARETLEEAELATLWRRVRAAPAQAA
jgi:cell division protease FtsH